MAIIKEYCNQVDKSRPERPTDGISQLKEVVRLIRQGNPLIVWTNGHNLTVDT